MLIQWGGGINIQKNKKYHFELITQASSKLNNKFAGFLKSAVKETIS